MVDHHDQVVQCVDVAEALGLGVGCDTLVSFDAQANRGRTVHFSSVVDHHGRPRLYPLPEVAATIRGVDESVTKRARKALEMTQAEFARLLDVGKSTIERWERDGATGTTLALMEIIAENPLDAYRVLKRLAERGG